MKTKVSKILAFALVVATVLGLASCIGGVGDSGVCTVLIENGESFDEYSVPLEEVEGDEGLLSVLIYLEEKEGVPLDYGVGNYGAYINSCGSVIPDATKSEYVQILTSVTADFDVSQYAESCEHEGVLLTTAGVGAPSLTVKDGATYMIRVGSY